jgi:hypothetical protein
MIASVSNEITCRNCGARNRLKARGAPGGARPVCGRCGAPLGEEQASVLNYEAAAAAPKDRRAQNRRAIVLIVVAAAALTGMAQLLLIMLR